MSRIYQQLAELMQKPEPVIVNPNQSTIERLSELVNSISMEGINHSTMELVETLAPGIVSDEIPLNSFTGELSNVNKAIVLAKLTDYIETL